MADSTDVDPLRQIITLIKDNSGYVAVILAFIASVFDIPGPLPKTTALITVVLTLTVLWSLRWPKIIAQLPQNHNQILVVGRYEKKVPKSLIERIIDAIRKSGAYSYKMSLGRRRVEVGVLSLFTLVSLGFMQSRLLGLYVELGGTYCPTEAKNELRVVITKFDIPSDSIFDRRLFDSMSILLKENATVCWLNHIVSSTPEAIELGDAQKAAIVIWGNEDPGLSEVHIVATYWDTFGNVREALPEEKSIFQAYGREQIPFLTQFALSEIMYMDGNEEKSRTQLKGALDKARTQDWPQKYPKDLADGYFLLGRLYKADGPQSENLRPAINAYTEAIRWNPDLDGAYFNRCQLRIYSEQLVEAREDCSMLIEKGSFLTPFAYLLRAETQTDREASESDFSAALESGMVDPNAVHITRGLLLLTKWKDYEGAIAAFNHALETEPQRVILYHYLGTAYLLEGEFDLAGATYKQAYPSASQKDKEDFIKDLQELSASAGNDNQELNQAILEIMTGFETGSFP